jgi:putative hydrolase of the HAD superfamily
MIAAVDAVLLDVGGVFFLPDHAEVVQALVRAGAHARAEVLDRAHYVALAESERDAGGDGAEALARYRQAYLRAAGVPPERAEEAEQELFDAELGYMRAPWTRLREQAAAELHELAGTGVGLAVVSNADGSVEDQLRAFGVCQVGDGKGVPVARVVDSTVVGVAKPDPRIFRIALDALAVEPARTIHLGDSLLADVAGARAAGIQPVHYDPLGLCPGDGHRDVASIAELVGSIHSGGSARQLPPEPPHRIP